MEDIILKKRLKRYGNATVVRFSPEELDVNKLKENDIVLVNIKKDGTKTKD